MKVLVFDVWSDFAHFRKYYTTTSPLTFSFPPPPTIAGILGAIYGTDKNQNEHLKVFGNCKLGLKILNPIKKVRMGLNLLETKGKNIKVPMSDNNLEPRTQIRTEFIRDPKFRIYISNDGIRIFSRLVEKVQRHESIYTISLGLSELLSGFKYVGLYEAKEVISDSAAEISSPVVVSNLRPDGLEIEIGKRYFREKIPIVMDQQRVVERYEDVIFEPQGKTIRARVKLYHKLENGENITFF